MIAIVWGAVWGTSPAQARGGVGVEVAVGASESQTLGDTILVSPLLEGRVTLGPGALVGAWGFAWASGDADEAMVWGNPYLAYSFPVAQGIRFSPGIAAPLATLSRPFDETGPTAESVAYVGARGMRGLRNLWLWLPDNLTVTAPLHLGHRVGLFAALTELTVALAVPVRDDAGDDDIDFIVQLATKLGYPIERIAVVGIALSAVWIPTNGGDNAQLAIDPYVSFRLHEQLSVGASLTINIDGPNGFAFDRGKLWGVHLGLDATW